MTDWEAVCAASRPANLRPSPDASDRLENGQQRGVLRFCGIQLALQPGGHFAGLIALLTMPQKISSD